MNFVENAGNLSQAQIVEATIPKDVMAHALSLRYSDEVNEAVQTLSPHSELDDLSPANMTLFRTRIAGGMATRLALGSYISHDVPSLFESSLEDQTGHIEEMLSRYLADRSHTRNILRLDTEADPLHTIAHRQTRGLVYKTRSAEINVAARAKMVLSYMNVAPGTFPPIPYAIAPVGKNDSVLVQAFGRDSITDKELVDIKTKRREVQSDVAMMKHLESINFLPGPSNEALADTVARQLHTVEPAEQILQWEVAYALWANHHATYQKYENYIHTLWPHGDFYATYDVKADSIRAMDRTGLYNAKEFAHPDMMVRALGILNKQGVIADPLYADIPFDPLSTQPHVRDEKSWTKRELLARGHHVAFGHVAVRTQRNLY